MIGERLRGIVVDDRDGSRVRLGRHPRWSMLLLVLHRGCGSCEALHAAVRGRADEIGRWGARIVATDGGGELRDALGLDPGEAAVVVLDRFGTIWEVHAAERRDHDTLPDGDALVESAKFLGTQCPECGVPDRPYTGEWTVV